MFFRMNSFFSFIEQYVSSFCMSNVLSLYKLIHFAHKTQKQKINNEKGTSDFGRLIVILYIKRSQ